MDSLTPIKINMKYVFGFLSILVVVLVSFLGFRYFQNRKIESGEMVANPPSNLLINGSVLYEKGDSIVSYNLSTHQEQTELNGLNANNPSPSLWAYSNGYLFAVTSNNEIVRKDLKSGEVNINKTDINDCLNYANENSYCDIDLLLPSMDGSKLAFALSGGSGEKMDISMPDDFVNVLKIIDYQYNKKIPVLRNNENFSIGKMQWFNNNQTFYLGNKTAFNLKDNIKSQLIGLTNDTIYPSYDGNRYLWFDENGFTAMDRDMFKIHRPNLVNSSLGKTFPNLFDPRFTRSDVGISFLQFPIVARDYKKINKAIPTKGQFSYLVEIDSGKSDIFFTDSSGTFKKLNPNNTDSYYLLAYLSSRNQVVALRNQEDRSYGVKTSKSQLVLLNEGNYSEFISNIDTGLIHYYEMDIADISPNLSRYINFSVSSDEKFILLADDKSSSYSLISLDSGNIEKLGVNFGSKFYFLSN